MTTLPTNIDSTYADSGTDASVALHQQYHDTIHAAVNGLSATYVAANIAPAPSGDVTGATDTAALQAWLDEATGADPLWQQLRLGTYYIDAAAVFPFAPGARLQGAGRDLTEIVQVTAGQPIIRFTTTDTHSVYWADFTLEYSAPQTNAASQAVTYEGAGNSYYSHVYERVRIRNAYDCWAIKDAVGDCSLWQTTWNNCDAFSTKHSVFSMAPAVAIGMPNHKVNGLRVDNTSGGVTSTGPVFNYQAVEFEHDGLDVEGWYNLTWNLNSGGSGTTRRVHIEHYTMDTGLEMAMISDQGQYRFEDISVTGTGTGQLGGTVLFHGGGANAVIIVEDLRTNMTIASGAFDLFYGSGARYVLVNEAIQIGGTALAASGSTDAGTTAVTRNVVTADVDTTTAAPAAGGAGALPATPLGYFTVHVNGAARKVAYY